MPSGPTDFAVNLFLIIFVLTTKGSLEVAYCEWHNRKPIYLYINRFEINTVSQFMTQERLHSAIL
jgi:hypothetical protein